VNKDTVIKTTVRVDKYTDKQSALADLHCKFGLHGDQRLQFSGEFPADCSLDDDDNLITAAADCDDWIDCNSYFNRLTAALDFISRDPSDEFPVADQAGHWDKVEFTEHPGKHTYDVYVFAQLVPGASTTAAAASAAPTASRKSSELKRAQYTTQENNQVGRFLREAESWFLARRANGMVYQEAECETAKKPTAIAAGKDCRETFLEDGKACTWRGSICSVRAIKLVMQCQRAIMVYQCYTV
jgi:hypothetical protein